MLGGASTWTEKDINIFEGVTGHVTHFYTPKDRILDFYEISTGESPIGQNRLGKLLKFSTLSNLFIFMTIDPKLVFQLHKIGIDVVQTDISHISDGHLKYRTYLDEIFDSINF